MIVCLSKHYMELGLGSRSTGKYINIIDGKFTERVNETTVGAVSRVNKLGSTVFELQHQFLAGYIRNIEIKDSEYGRNYVFTLDIGDNNTINLQLGESNSVTLKILKCLPNADLSQPIRFELSKDDEDRTQCFIKQQAEDGTMITLKQKWTKAEPGECPQWEQIIVKGKETWDNSKEIVFLEEYTMKNILPMLGKVAPVSFDDLLEDPEEVKKEDLPF